MYSDVMFPHSSCWPMQMDPPQPLQFRPSRRRASLQMPGEPMSLQVSPFFRHLLPPQPSTLMPSLAGAVSQAAASSMSWASILYLRHLVPVQPRQRTPSVLLALLHMVSEVTSSHVICSPGIRHLLPVQPFEGMPKRRSDSSHLLRTVISEAVASSLKHVLPPQPRHVRPNLWELLHFATVEMSSQFMAKSRHLSPPQPRDSIPTKPLEFLQIRSLVISLANAPMLRQELPPQPAQVMFSSCALLHRRGVVITLQSLALVSFEMQTLPDQPLVSRPYFLFACLQSSGSVIRLALAPASRHWLPLQPRHRMPNLS
mmetsp:Transcript_30491/g.82557  ORF Transcript_30491/g.82557 Transcript_30491/m.82557 type:complete len:314 (+) Transcript_30491:166-1107(+)